MQNRNWNWEDVPAERLYLPEPKLSLNRPDMPRTRFWYKTAVCFLIFLLIWGAHRVDFTGSAGIKRFLVYVYSTNNDLNPYLKRIGERLVASEQLRSVISQPVEEPAPQKPVTTMRILYPVAEGKLIGYSQSTNQYALSIQCRPGQIVRAPQVGRIAAVTGEKVNGYTVQIDHGNGFVSILGSFPESWVKPDDQVQYGQTIGKLSTEGNNVLLTYKLTYQGQPIDPLNYLGGRQP